MKPDSRDGASGFYFPNRLCKFWLAKMIFLYRRESIQHFPLPLMSASRDLMGFVYITGKTTALPQNGAHLSDIPRDGKDGHQ